MQVCAASSLLRLECNFRVTTQAECGLTPAPCDMRLLASCLLSAPSILFYGTSLDTCCSLERCCPVAESIANHASAVVGYDLGSLVYYQASR